MVEGYNPLRHSAESRSVVLDERRVKRRLALDAIAESEGSRITTEEADSLRRDLLASNIEASLTEIVDIGIINIQNRVEERFKSKRQRMR